MSVPTVRMLKVKLLCTNILFVTILLNPIASSPLVLLFILFIIKRLFKKIFKYFDQRNDLINDIKKDCPICGKDLDESQFMNHLMVKHSMPKVIFFLKLLIFIMLSLYWEINKIIFLLIKIINY